MVVRYLDWHLMGCASCRYTAFLEQKLWCVCNSLPLSLFVCHYDIKVTSENISVWELVEFVDQLFLLLTSHGKKTEEEENETVVWCCVLGSFASIPARCPTFWHCWAVFIIWDASLATWSHYWWRSAHVPTSCQVFISFAVFVFYCQHKVPLM